MIGKVAVDATRIKQVLANLAVLRSNGQAMCKRVAASRRARKDCYTKELAKTMTHNLPPLRSVPASPAVAHCIQRLLYDYARYVDENRPDDIAALFTTTCWVDFGPGSPTGGPMRSRVEVAQRLRSGLSIFSATSHHVSNIQVDEISPVQLSAVSYVYAWHRFTDERPDAHVWGRYCDVLTLDDGQWLISERVLKVAGQQDFPIEFTPIERCENVAGANTDHHS